MTDRPTSVRGTLPAVWRHLRRDYAYVLPGYPLALFSFALLVPLTAASVATVVVWVGLLLLPLTLTIASGFAQLSRKRLRAWGVDLPPVRYRPTGPGIRGALGRMADPRRWLDLAFETVVAFPVRLATFVVAVTWTLAGAGAFTFPLWGWAPPGDPGWIQLLELIWPSAVPDEPIERYLLTSVVNVALGVVLLLSLPAVLRALARGDALLATALLGGRRSGDQHSPDEPGTPSGREPGGDATFSGRAWSYLAASFLAVVLVAVGWPVTATVYGVHPAVAMVLAIGHAAALVLVVPWPAAGIGLGAVATLGMMTTTAETAGAGPWPWPVTTLLVHCFLVLALALRRPWVWAMVAWGVGALLTVLALLLDGTPDGAVANGVVLVSVSGGAGLLGILVRLWMLSAGRVERAETVSAEEVHRRRELQERNRIARELHDVVAHSMSVINVQATTARYRKPGMDEAVQQEFADIAESSRRALGEMRALLGILRADDDAPTAPAPGLEDIGDLVAASRASGASISYSGQAPQVPATVGLTAFRVVQEALSNALRHAPGSAVEVTTQVEDERLVVRVANTPPETDRSPAPGSGLGLAGLRERVTSLGGRVEASPTTDGGFAVVAVLPTTGD